MATASSSPATFTRGGFTLLETAVTIAMLTVVAAFLVPTWRLVQLRSDLHVAADAARRGLDRARFLSQTGYEDSTWGYQATQGIVFKGESFATRDGSFDETVAVPATVAASGVLEVTFSRLYGMPSMTGAILFTSIGGGSMQVNIEDGMALPPPAAHSVSSRTASHASSISSLSAATSSPVGSSGTSSSARSHKSDDHDHDK